MQNWAFRYVTPVYSTSDIQLKVKADTFHATYKHTNSVLSNKWSQMLTGKMHTLYQLDLNPLLTRGWVPGIQKSEIRSRICYWDDPEQARHK